MSCPMSYFVTFKNFLFLSWHNWDRYFGSFDSGRNLNFIVNLNYILTFWRNEILHFRNAGRGMWTVANAATIRVGTHVGPYKEARLTPSDYLAAKESGYAWEILDSERKKRIVGFVDPGPDPDPLPNPTLPYSDMEFLKSLERRASAIQ